MKPAWDKLMKKHEGSETLLVGDADCEGSGSALCDAVGVEGFPTIKWGSPDDLQDYEGGRDSKSLVKFAGKLTPMCGVHNLGACNSKKVSQIKQMQTMSEAELTEFIATVDACWGGHLCSCADVACRLIDCFCGLGHCNWDMYIAWKLGILCANLGEFLKCFLKCLLSVP